MDALTLWLWGNALSPLVLMTLAAALPLARRAQGGALWRPFIGLAVGALFFALLTPLSLGFVAGTQPANNPVPGLALSPVHAWMAVLVQLLGTVIGVFSSRYLQGEPGQPRYVAALSGVLAAVHLLLMADHWLVLIAAWALVGSVLQHLLCFYAERPFALLAAHKKRIADRLADVLLIAAATLAWSEVGSGSLTALWSHLDTHGGSILLHASAVCLVLAVILRTALFPVHGWLIQVMEAPTPVSALLHAGVVNLSGFVLIRFAPLLEAAPAARWLLVIFGLGTAVLAGLVMLTRISIKVRLAWSTVAQMGFMVLECGLGLYTLAALHLVGHSLYKAHAFLSASSTVQQSKLQRMRGDTEATVTSLALAPVGAVAVVILVQHTLTGMTWPWWWSGVLALAWAPLLWLPALHAGEATLASWRILAGVAMVAGLTALAALAHLLPLGTRDAPDAFAGTVTLVGMTALYVSLVALQRRSPWLSAFRRWSYAGFYVDEFYTRLALRWWPTSWVTAAKSSTASSIAEPVPAAAPQ
jgi:NAD(P)H-quinone oxidoreductase subunit 5